MRRIVVVGNGMVGHKFVELLCATVSEVEVTVFCEEPMLAYDRVQLSGYFSGTSAEELAIAHIDHYQAWGVTTYTSAAVMEIDRTAQTVTAADGTLARYDTLVLATGSYPFVPPIPGNDQAHCHVYRTIADLQGMETSGAESSIGVVVGGGLLGGALKAYARLFSLRLVTLLSNLHAFVWNGEE